MGRPPGGASAVKKRRHLWSQRRSWIGLAEKFYCLGVLTVKHIKKRFELMDFFEIINIEPLD